MSRVLDGSCWTPTNGKPRGVKELVSALNGPSEWVLGSAGVGERKAKQKG